MHRPTYIIRGVNPGGWGRDPPDFGLGSRGGLQVGSWGSWNIIILSCTGSRPMFESGDFWREIHCVRMKSSTQQKVSQVVQNCKYLPEIINSTTVTISTRDPQAVLKYSW